MSAFTNWWPVWFAAGTVTGVIFGPALRAWAAFTPADIDTEYSTFYANNHSAWLDRTDPGWLERRIIRDEVRRLTLEQELARVRARFQTDAPGQ